MVLINAIYYTQKDIKADWIQGPAIDFIISRVFPLDAIIKPSF